MAWEQLWIDKPHLAYAIIGGFTSIFSLVSLYVKEKLYIGEATVATIVGIIFGPHALNLFSPTNWGNVDFITLELSRIVLIVQIFAVAVELPKKYMLRHWWSVFVLLVPVMTAGWLISSVFIWKLVPSLRWVEALVVAACITATDPVLASAVVGKGKFSKRVPGHLRNILSAESGCNDGMAFPFTYLSIYLIRYAGHPGEIIKHWVCVTILYECIFGCVLGAVIGYVGRHMIKFAEKNNLIDRESFLVFYFVLALFCTGVGSILGTDDLLVSFAAGTAFSWDGWFTHRTEETHVSNVIDLLLNLAFFVYFGSIIPWEQFNNAALQLSPWKLSIIAILIILFRRIPVMLALKPLIPDIRTWREALFCGHFGPIGVGAIFTSLLARAELEHEEPTPLQELPPPGSENYMIVATIWPVVCFFIIASIIVHGSSIAVFTLGKRINTMAITMSYTTGNNNGPSWLQRLPRIESGQSLSFRKVETQEGPGRLFRRGTKVATTDAGTTVERPAPAQAAGRMSRRHPRRRRTDDDEMPIDLGAGARVSDDVIRHIGEANLEEQINLSDREVYQEGPNLIIEDRQGEVLETINSQTGEHKIIQRPVEVSDDEDEVEDGRPRRPRSRLQPVREPTKAIAYQLGDDIIVENDEGEVIRRYKVNHHPSAANASHSGNESGIYDRALSWVGLRRSNTGAAHGMHSGSGDALKDLEITAEDSNDQATSGSSSIPEKAIGSTDLPRNFLQRRASNSSSGSSRPRVHAAGYESDEETPAERKRRLAALQGSREHEDDEDDRPTSAGADERRPSGITFEGETDADRERRQATLDVYRTASPVHGGGRSRSPPPRKTVSVYDDDNDNDNDDDIEYENGARDAPAESDDVLGHRRASSTSTAAPRGITWGTAVRRG
ncbi:Sodium/hydrogen exchanger family-domain-containing protein [Dipodascopsis tothii]|uniref:Sodium/hydrogen exchanger family-domain-containing protein n=1 Tax=Dipodascopsis tothii TaxID=44089 RepID=UPI0034CFB704